MPVEIQIARKEGVTAIGFIMLFFNKLLLSSPDIVSRAEQVYFVQYINSMLRGLKDGRI